MLQAPLPSRRLYWLGHVAWAGGCLIALFAFLSDHLWLAGAVFPFNFIIALASWHFAKRIWLQRRRQGDYAYCFECGYDLRGTLTTGNKRCPECGVRFI